MRPVRGAVLSFTLMGSYRRVLAAYSSISRLNGAAFARRIFSSSTKDAVNTQLCLEKSTPYSPTAVISSTPSTSTTTFVGFTVSLRNRTHQFHLPDRTGRLMDYNFLVR